MRQGGREAYEKEIAELKEKLANAEADFRLYNSLHDCSYARLSEADAARIAGGCAIQRAMADAYVQWEEENK